MTYRQPAILAVDRDPQWLDWVVSRLDRAGYCVSSTTSIDRAIGLTRKRPFDLALVDSRQASAAGDALGRLARSRRGKSRFVLLLFGVTPSVSETREPFKRNVLDCVLKPFDEKDLLHVVTESIADAQRLARRAEAGAKSGQSR